MTSYFAILPIDLTLELSLYFNYRDTILACQFLQCQRVDIWLNKIRKELNYSNEFIQEYVYDTANDIQKTLLPVNEKYLELKARRSADFGCEFYQHMSELIKFASLSTDFKLAMELVKYFYKINHYLNPQDYYEDYTAKANRALTYKIMMRNALAVNDITLANYAKNRSIYGQFYSNLNQYIVEGLYEYSPNPDPKLLEQFNVNPENIKPKYIQVGLANGGHLKELLQMKPGDINDSLGIAVWRGRKNIIDHFNLLSTGPTSTEYLAILIETGHIELLPNIDTLSENPRSEIMRVLISFGYTEILKKYVKYITNKVITNSIRTCILYNHLDTLNFLFEVAQVEVMLAIKERVDLTTFKFYRLTVDTLQYLIDHQLISFYKVPLYRINEKLDKMKTFNVEAYEYLRIIL